MSAKHGYITFSCPSDSGGFFSNYFSVLSTIGICAIKNLIPYVDSTNTWFNPTCDFENDTVLDSKINPWNWWFVQEEKKESIVYENIGLDRTGIPHVPKVFISHQALPIFRGLAKDFCKIQPYILDEEELLYKEYIQNKTTLGILARGTEMLVHHKEYPKVTTEFWPDIIRSCLNNHPDIDNIFLVSDDREIIETITDAYPQTKYLRYFFRSTNQTEEQLSDKTKPWWLFSSDNIINHRRRVGEESLIQTRLLSRCDYFIGTHSGMFNAVNFFRENSFKTSYLI